MPGRLPWIMLFFVRQLTFLRVGWIVSLLVASMLGFTCQAVRGFSHICSLFRARLCWGGGSVANMGFVSLYRRGL